MPSGNPLSREMRELVYVSRVKCKRDEDFIFESLFFSDKSRISERTLGDILRRLDGSSDKEIDFFLSPKFKPVQRGFGNIRGFIAENEIAAIRSPLVWLNNAFEYYAVTGPRGHTGNFSYFYTVSYPLLSFLLKSVLT